MERNKVIDICKGIGILSVVFGHIPTAWGGVIYQFHMALFFILSGFCFKPQYLDAPIRFIYKRFVQLIVPIYIFISIAFVIKNSCLDKQTVNDFIEQYHLFGTFWFLKSLFLCNLITIIVLYSCKQLNVKNHIYTLLIILIVSTIQDALVHDPKNTLFIEFFYFLGYLINAKGIVGSSMTEISLETIIVFGLTAATLLFIPPLMPAIITDVTFRLYIPYAIIAVSASWCCYVISGVIAKHTVVSDVLTVIGRNTMPIVLLQWASFCIVDILCDYCYGDNAMDFNILTAVKFISGVTLPLLAYRIYRLLNINKIYNRIFHI